MSRSFAITTATPSVRLGSTGQGEVSFTVTNALGRQVRARALLEPEGATPKDWLSLEGESERDFVADGTHQYTVHVSLSPGAPEGSLSFHLSMVSVENPDEDFTVGPSVALQVSRPSAPVLAKKPFPWWAVALAAGLVLIILVGALIVRPHPKFLRFNGTSAYIDLGNPKALDFNGMITVEAWIRPQAFEGIHSIVTHHSPSRSSGEFFLRIHDANYEVGSWLAPFEYGSWDGELSSEVVSAGAAVPSSDLNQWIHLAGVYDGAQWLLYRNGEKVAATVDPFHIGSPFQPNAPWTIGARGGTEWFFQGDIRDVMIWNVPRSQEEIRMDMEHAPKKDAPGLVGYWPLSEGRGVAALELTAQQSHGIIHGAEWRSGPGDSRAPAR